MRRTAVINQVRGLLLERGIALRKGRCHVDAALPGILEDAPDTGFRHRSRRRQVVGLNAFSPPPRSELTTTIARSMIVPE
jgi:hypothetical protein